MKDERCRRKSKFRVSVARVAFNKKKNLFYQLIGLKFEEEPGDMLIS